MGSIEETSNKLDIIIVGGGIAGLAAATTLSQKGHNVTVLEWKPSLNEFGASIGILCNGVRPLKAWGLEQEFEKVVTKNGFLDVRNGATNAFLGHNPHCIKDFSLMHYGEEIWNINRVDYQQTLANAAIQSGAKIVFDAETEKVDVEKCVIHLKDGREMTADVIIGADGMKSAVRHSIPALSHVEPVAWEEACFRCTVPKERMRGKPRLEKLLNSGDEYVWTVPGRYILSWPLPEHRAYDVVTVIQRPSDVPPGRWGVKAEPEEARREFNDFCPEVVELLAEIDTAMKWTLAELPPIPTFRSENGRVVLMGDAAHAMVPHSASGGNSAIEDAACIGECLDWASRQSDKSAAIATATQAYEALRKPRVERMQTASQEGYWFLGANDPNFLPIRDQALADATKAYDAELAMSMEERQAKKAKWEPDMNARFPLEPYLQWLYGYDAIEETKKYLSTLA